METQNVTEGTLNPMFLINMLRMNGFLEISSNFEMFNSFIKCFEPLGSPKTNTRKYFKRKKKITKYLEN